MKNTAAYQVTIRDAAHLSENFYLLDSFLNLGVFTAAINHVNIEKELKFFPRRYHFNVRLWSRKNIKKDSSLMPTFNKIV